MTDVLIVGCGAMGSAHARALASLPDVRIVGLVSRGPSKQQLASALRADLPLFDTLAQALAATRPHAICIATWPDTHEALAIEALQAGAHVFIEKPLAPTLEAARRIMQAAQKAGRMLITGYILRHDPLWQAFIAQARKLGQPLVMRIALNQPSHGAAWDTHRALLASASPLLDCAVHYIDIMAQIAGRPQAVSALAARLDPALLHPNYGQLHLHFEKGSVGWFESGWGPMIAREPAVFCDASGPHGTVCLQGLFEAPELIVHPADADRPARGERLAVTPLGWEGLCRAQMAHFLATIADHAAMEREQAQHHEAVLMTLEVALAADLAAAQRRTVTLA